MDILAGVDADHGRRLQGFLAALEGAIDGVGDCGGSRDSTTYP
jgi:hypothetical protein